MSWTGHNQFFGWINFFKITRSNSIMAPDINQQRPFPIIIDDPNVGQVLSNWNSADTGLFVSSLTIGLLTSKYLLQRHQLFNSIIKKRYGYNRYVNIFGAFGLLFGFRNSTYRLQGYVPNGLPKKRTEQLVKYDYTTQFLTNTPWKYLVQPLERPVKK